MILLLINSWNKDIDALKFTFQFGDFTIKSPDVYDRYGTEFTFQFGDFTITSCSPLYKTTSSFTFQFGDFTMFLSLMQVHCHWYLHSNLVILLLKKAIFVEDNLSLFTFQFGDFTIMKSFS